jgi:hypothetical protein
MQSGKSVRCLLSSPFLYAIFSTFIVGTKLPKIADIKECFRLKTIKLADNQMVIQNHPNLGFSDSLPLITSGMTLEVLFGYTSFTSIYLSFHPDSAQSRGGVIITSRQQLSLSK